MRRPASLLTVICLSSLFLVPASAIEAGSTQSGAQNAQAEPDKPSIADSRPVTAAEVRRGPLTVAVSEDPADPLDCGFTGDSLILSVRHGRRPVDSISFCSAYGISRVRHVIDRLGEHYALLEHGEGHGTNATSYFLTVYRLGGNALDERARWLTREGAGPTAVSSYSYTVETPASGGIIVSGQWSLQGEPVADDPWRSRRRTLVAVDATLHAS